MSRADDAHMIRRVSAAASNPTFSYAILPGTSEADLLGFDASGCQQARHVFADLSISIRNRIAIGTRFRKRFLRLLHYPSACGRSELMEDLASAVLDGEENNTKLER